MVSKFADEPKIDGVGDSEVGYLRVQWNLDQMGQWAKEWQMEFNLDKCEVLHFGRTNQDRTYILNAQELAGHAAAVQDIDEATFGILNSILVSEIVGTADAGESEIT
eukprot:g40946.t1